VGQHETSNERDIAEADQMMRRQSQPGSGVREQLSLLNNILRGTAPQDAGNPEDETVLGGFVREVPVLKVPEAVVAGAGLRGVDLESEAGADAVADRVGDRNALLGGQLAVDGAGRLVPLRDGGVGDRDEVVDLRRRGGYFELSFDDSLKGTSQTIRIERIAVLLANLALDLAELTIQPVVLFACDDGRHDDTPCCSSSHSPAPYAPTNSRCHRSELSRSSFYFLSKDKKKTAIVTA